jgi:translation initiation factor IF-2
MAYSRKRRALIVGALSLAATEALGAPAGPEHQFGAGGPAGISGGRVRVPPAGKPGSTPGGTPGGTPNKGGPGGGKPNAGRGGQPNAGKAPSKGPGPAATRGSTSPRGAAPGYNSKGQPTGPGAKGRVGKGKGDGGGRGRGD